MAYTEGFAMINYYAEYCSPEERMENIMNQLNRIYDKTWYHPVFRFNRKDWTATVHFDDAELVEGSGFTSSIIARPENSNSPEYTTSSIMDDTLYSYYQFALEFFNIEWNEFLTKEERIILVAKYFSGITGATPEKIQELNHISKKTYYKLLAIAKQKLISYKFYDVFGWDTSKNDQLYKILPTTELEVRRKEAWKEIKDKYHIGEKHTAYVSPHIWDWAPKYHWGSK